MNLYNFEQYVASVIINRGLAYVADERILQIDEVDNNLFVAEVEGSYRYEVQVQLDDESNIIAMDCDCPYDSGPVCKHIVAVLFRLRHWKGKGKDKDTLMESGAETETDLKSLLMNQCKEDIVDFMMLLVSEYDDLRHRIHLHFKPDDDKSIFQHCRELITAYIHEYDRDGFIAYQDVFEAVKGAELVLEKAKRYREADDNKVLTVELCLCVFEEMLHLLNYADDSSGVIGGLIEDSLNLIEEVALTKTTMAGDEQELIYNLLMKTAEDHRLNGWPDWQVELLKISSCFVDTPNKKNKWEQLIFPIIAKRNKDTWLSNYFMEKITLLRYEMIKKMEGKAEADVFLKNHMQFPEIRKMMVRQALNQKQYDQAIELALEGEKQAEQQRLPGLVKTWKELRYQAYRHAQQLDKMRELALELVLDGNYHYYQELKASYTQEEWSSVYPKIIDMMEEGSSRHTSVYTNILIDEGETKRLLAFVKQHPHTIERFYRYLIKEFAEEVYTIFLAHIAQTASRSKTRKDYQEVCRIIRLLKKAGGKQHASEMVKKLMKQYARRPAFRDELSRV